MKNSKLKVKSFRFLIVIFIFALFIFNFASSAYAVSWWPLVPCGLNEPTAQEIAAGKVKLDPSYYQPCNRCDLFKLLKNIIDFVLIGLMPPVAAILFVWGGFLILMGGANPGWITQGKSIFWNAAIGVAIISASWLITNTIIRSVAADNIAPEWWKFQCSVTVPPQQPPSTQKYFCNSNNQCVADPNGQYSTNNCDNKCQPVVGGSLSITTSSLPNAIQGTAYAQYVEASGGTTPYTWTITSGALPAGLTLNDFVGITGTPTTAGTSTFTVKVEDASTPKKSATKQLSITVGGTTITAPSITTSSLSDASQGSAYSQTVQATGGKTPYSWSITGSLPSGLMINSATGEIFGKPTVSGTFTFNVAVQDSSSPVKQATKQLSIKVVAPAASVVISNVASSNVTNTSAVITWTTDKPSTSQIAYGATTAYGPPTPLDSNLVTNHRVTITGLSPGMTYNYQAISSITGFTARSSNYTFKTTGTPPPVSVVISNVISSNITNTNATITWTTDKPSTSQVAYGIATAYGSNTPLNSSQVTSHSVTINGLSPGTTYNYQAISSITGFTAKSSNYTFKTTGTAIQPLIITTSSQLPDGVAGSPYSQTLQATGGTPPYRWKITSGRNVGLSLGLSTGIISGTPTAPDIFTFIVQVDDSASLMQSGIKQLSIVIKETTTGVTCKFTGVNLCQASNRTPYNNQTMVCSASACNQYVSAVNQYAVRTGISNGANFLKAIMIKESACNAQADSGHAQGLMQLKPSTANIYKNRCGVTENITGQWLKNNPELSICLAAEYMKALTQTSCGNTPRSVAAGYNGGSGACDQSRDCSGETSCAGGPVKRWECLYDNLEHTVCNDTRPVNYDETRDYAIKVLYCYNNPGF